MIRTRGLYILEGYFFLLSFYLISCSLLRQRLDSYKTSSLYRHARPSASTKFAVSIAFTQGQKQHPAGLYKPWMIVWNFYILNCSSIGKY